MKRNTLNGSCGSLSMQLCALSCLLFTLCLLWISYAIFIHNDPSHPPTVPAGLPPVPFFRRTRDESGRPFRSPAPVIKPNGIVKYVPWVGPEYNLRLCTCLKDWKKADPNLKSICKCNKDCPRYVDPPFLTDADGQELCSLVSVSPNEDGFNCYAECEGIESHKISWFATPCTATSGNCDSAIPLTKRPWRANNAPPAKASVIPVNQPQPQSQPVETIDDKAMNEERKKETKVEEEEVEEEAVREVIKEGTMATNPEEDLIDLRGLNCELLDGKERCFLEDEQGRELCPDHVTSDYLSSPHDQYLCTAPEREKYFCTAGCQEGSNEVRWGAHEIAWCDDPKNRGSCPDRTFPIRRSDFKLKKWSEVIEPEKKCVQEWKKGTRPGKVARLTMGLLTHEPISFRKSMVTYEELGLFDIAIEFLIYINKRTPEVDAVAEEFRIKYPGIIKVMGDAFNHGIARAMTYLTGNASFPNFLFLERDFQLLEPATCVVEQLEAGVDLVESGEVHVVRYRHRKRPGRPNWAVRMFKGHEDDAMTGRQPNLFCNVFYWVPEPEKRWPDKFKICSKPGSKVTLWCSDSYYCNWTNNPQIWSIKWWNEAYVSIWEKGFTSVSAWQDLESHMNWEPGSWNTRHWVVAQGEGLFVHRDSNNFGIV
jgi:hypothetical protein